MTRRPPRTPVVHIRWLALFLALVAGCSDDSAGECVDGAVDPCACDDGTTGTQRCEGARWQPCQCLDAGPGDSGPDGAPDGTADATPAATLGYRVISATVELEPGTPTSYDIALWYPSTSTEQATAYDYDGNLVTTALARDGAVAPGDHPLVVFSHGATGCGLSSAFLTERLAREGFVVAAPDYPDDLVACRIEDPVPPYSDAEALAYVLFLRNVGLDSDCPDDCRERFAYRPLILRRTIELLLDEQRQTFHIDAGRLGLAGHSFGAWTSLLVTGVATEHEDDRVVAVAALSGPVNDNVYRPSELADLGEPVLFLYGSEEVAAGRADDEALLYQPASTPKLLAEILGADHFTFSGGIREEYATLAEYVSEDPARAAIVELTVTFLRAYVAGDAAAETALASKPAAGVGKYRFAP